MLSCSKIFRCTPIKGVSSVEPLITTFVTDLEGDGLYFDRFVANSKALSRDPITRELTLRDGCRFVFGGDLFDKGTHDLRLCKEFLSLKEKYGDRVTFIIGNRDMQKHKYLSLLRPEWLDRPVEDHVWPYYMASVGVTYKQFLEKSKTHHRPYAYLNYLVNYCYGAPNSLTRVRQELFEENVIPQWKADGTRKSYEELRDEFYEVVLRSDEAEPHCATQHSGVPSFNSIRKFLKSKISEEEVLSLYNAVVNPIPSFDSSFKSSHDYKGIVDSYVSNAQLAAVHDGALYVHGAVRANGLGYVPDLTLEERHYEATEQLPGRVVNDLDEWVRSINSFKADALQEWREKPYFDEKCLSEAISNETIKDGRFPKRGGGALFAFGHSRSCQGKSPVIGSWFGDAKPAAGTPSASGYHDLRYVDMVTVSYLGMSGVSVAMTGHQPVSDIPLVINQPGLRVICGDISYCNGKGGRGEAVSEILYNGEDGALRLHGKMVNGDPYDFILDEDGPRAVGRRLQDGWWVRAELPDGKFLVRRTMNRFYSHETKIMTVDEVEANAIESSGHLYEKSAVAGEDAPLPFTRDDLKPLRNHEKADPSIKTKRCCGTRKE